MLNWIRHQLRAVSLSVGQALQTSCVGELKHSINSSGNLLKHVFFFDDSWRLYDKCLNLHASVRFSSLHNNTRVFSPHSYFFRHNHNNTQLLYPWRTLFFPWRHIYDHECSIPLPGSCWSSWCCTALYKPKKSRLVPRRRYILRTLYPCAQICNSFLIHGGFDLLCTNSGRFFCSRLIGAWSVSSVLLTDNQRRPCSCNSYISVTSPTTLAP